MFRTLTVIAFMASAIWFYFSMRKSELSFSEVSNLYLKNVKKAFSDLLKIRVNTNYENLKTIKRISYFITLFLFDILFITGFLPVIYGIHLTGVLLLIHVAVAPLFAVSVLFSIVLWAADNRLKDGENLLADSGLKKLMFWLMAIVVVPVMMSIVLGMYPVFGTEGQIILLDTHRYSVLLLSVFAIIHSGLLLKK